MFSENQIKNIVNQGIESGDIKTSYLVTGNFEDEENGSFIILTGIYNANLSTISGVWCLQLSNSSLMQIEINFEEMTISGVNIAAAAIQLIDLSNGDVVPCCLDGNGVIKLGNIFEEKFTDILNNDRYINMRKGFNDNKLTFYGIYTSDITPQLVYYH